MVTTLIERLTAFFTGVKPGARVLSREAQKAIEASAKRVRSKDYVFCFELPNGGESHEIIDITTAGWFFILTNVTYWRADGDGSERVKISFKNFVPDLPIASDLPFNSYPAPLVMGSQNSGRFEEAKNLWYVLGERIALSCEAYAAQGTPTKSYIMLSGIEIDLNDPGVF